MTLPCDAVWDFLKDDDEIKKEHKEKFYSAFLTNAYSPAAYC